MRISVGLSRIFAVSTFVFLSAWTNAAPPPSIPVETDDTLSTLTPRTAIDAKGNALAIWARLEDDTHSSILANRYSATTRTWGTPTVLDFNTAISFAVPIELANVAIAADPSGNAVAAWGHSGGEFTRIFASRYIASANGGAWQTPVPLEFEDLKRSAVPRMAVDEKGNAIVVWNRTPPFGGNGEDGGIDVVAARYDAARNAWGPAVVLSSEPIISGGFLRDGALFPEIAMNAQGNAVVVWTESKVSTTEFSFSEDIKSSRYNVATGRWEGPLRIETRARFQDFLDPNSGAGNAVYRSNLPTVGIDARGNAIASWVVSGCVESFEPCQIRASRYSVATGKWAQRAAVISDFSVGDLGMVSPPRIGVDASGNALATWAQVDETSADNATQWIQANRFSAASGTWDRPVTITDKKHVDFDPRIAINPKGDAALIWTQKEPNTGPTIPGGFSEAIFRSRYVAATRTWTAPKNLSNDGSVSAFFGDTAINKAGDTMTVWQQLPSTPGQLINILLSSSIFSSPSCAFRPLPAPGLAACRPEPLQPAGPSFPLR